MRARNLKPSFFKNENLATLPPLTRLLYAALWCLADREGRLEDRPLRIKAEAFPYDSCDIDKMLDSLADFSDPLIIRYQVDSKCYIQVVAAQQHFNPHPNEKSSEIPPFSSGVVKSNKAVVKCNKAITLNPDVMNPESPLIESAPIGAFETIWSKYPRRLGKKAALRHFSASVKTPQDWLDIQNALENFIKKMRSEGRAEEYIQQGSTWFNNWRDWVRYGGVVMPRPAPMAPPKPKETEPEISESDRQQMLETLANAKEKLKTAGRVIV